MLTRRQTLATLAALAVAGTLGTAYSWWDCPADAPYTQLSQEEAAFIDALAEAAFPTGGAPEVGGRSVQASRYVDQILHAMVPFQADLVRLSLHAMENATLPTHAARFSNLPTEQASTVLQNWLSSDLPELRNTVTSVYLFVGMAYTSHPEVSKVLSIHFRCGYGV